MTARAPVPAMHKTSAGDPASFRERLRDGILGIAVRIIAEEGLGALQARRVAVEAGCSVGTIYNIFGDLDGLIIAGNSETLVLMEAELRTAYQETEASPMPDRLTALAIKYMTFAFAHRERWSAIFEHRLPPGKMLPVDYDQRRAELLALLSHAIGGNTMPSELRQRAARSLFASVHGIITLALANKLSPFDPKSVDADIRFIVTAASHGLAQSR
ncbi:MAG: TetR/AcrR family transcriptional regulator [Hyphomicrobium sp.]